VIVLDTDVISHLMRRPPAGLVRRLADVPTSEQATTTISLGELAYGALKVGRPEFYDRALDLLEGVSVFPFDEAAVPHYARVRVALEQAGTRLADPDLRIAAIALANGVTLITGNLRYFSRVAGLSAENWLSP
jgi:tRNA(fMet)-specific endonuclease VapC